ncbi:MAG: hypothetical protein ACUVQY_07880 [Thermoproteota archaeon]
MNKLLETLLIEGLYAGMFFLWVLFVVGVLTYLCYKVMIKRVPDRVAVYYNRKIIHILAGGLIGYLVPFIFSTPFYPLVLSMVLGIFTLIPHLINRTMYWFQTSDNAYEVHFCLSWGLILTAGWFFTGGFLVWGNTDTVHGDRRCCNWPSQEHDVQETYEVLVGKPCYGHRQRYAGVKARITGRDCWIVQ